MKRLYFLVVFIVLAGSSHSMMAQTTRTQRPVKNPPQYPNIIDVENKAGATKTPTESSPDAGAALVRAVESLAGEVRTLVWELRALNVRQQAQLDLLRLTRGDLRIDSYERELKVTNERLGQLAREEQELRSSLTPEGLAMHASRVGTLNRDDTIRAIKQDLESRLNALLPEKQQLELRKAELEANVVGFRDANERAERRLDLVEEVLRQIAAPQNPSKPEQD